MAKNKEIQIKETNQSKIIFLGALIGALTGAGAGYLLASRLEEEDEIHFSARDGLKLGGSLLSLMRQVSKIGK